MYIVLYQRQNKTEWLLHAFYDSLSEARDGEKYLKSLKVKDSRILRVEYETF